MKIYDIAKIFLLTLNNPKVGLKNISEIARMFLVTLYNH